MAGLSLKKTDSRYNRFIELYGPDQQGYEIDSLPAHILRQKILEKLNLYMDVDALKKVVELEDAIDVQLKKQLSGSLNSIVTELLKSGVPGSTLPLTEQLRYLLAENKLDELGKAIKEAEASYLRTQEEDAVEEEVDEYEDDYDEDEEDDYED